MSFKLKDFPVRKEGRLKARSSEAERVSRIMNGSVRMKFTKMHGLGNDYIYVNAFTETIDDPHALAIAVSDRHFGVGADGLVLIAPSRVADFQMLMYNADGSQGEMCGNASRCVAKYVYERGMTDRTVITLETLAGIKTLHLTVKDGSVESVRVDMGRAIVDCESVPCLLGEGVVTKAPITVLGRTFEITPVSMGNPHGVIFLEEPVEAFDLTRYGSALETHPMFPKKANIEFVNVLARDRLRMRVWERGSGITLACGTGSCAALVAAKLCGLADSRAAVVLDGGELVDEWDEETGHVFMTGPATHVFEGEI